MAQGGGQRTHAIFKVQAGGRARVVVFDTQDLTVGRAPENDLAFDDPEMSRRHAVFRRTQEGCRVEDMGTSNGTGVNGESVDHAILAHGDVVRIGEVEIIYAQTTRSPATLGAAVEYASQLKSRGTPMAGLRGNGEATILGLVDAVGDEEGEDFEVLPAGDFDFASVAAPNGGSPRDLDLEIAALEPDPLADSALGEAADAAPSTGPSDLWELDDEPAAPESDRVALTLEVEGLRGELRRVIEGLAGKVLEVPSLRVRIKARDLD